MTYQEIRNKVNELKEENNKIILEGLHILNEKIGANMAAIEELQNECDHCFEDGVCIYCDMEAMNI